VAPRVFLAPTFDHASSLGRDLTEADKQDRLTTKDRGRQVEAWVKSPKARSALFRESQDIKPLSLLDAFQEAAAKFPQAASAWLQILREADLSGIEAIVSRVPEERMSLTSKRFALEVLRINRQNLLRLYP